VRRLKAMLSDAKPPEFEEKLVKKAKELAERIYEMEIKEFNKEPIAAILAANLMFTSWALHRWASKLSSRECLFLETIMISIYEWAKNEKSP
jgi:hypothetical protein